MTINPHPKVVVDQRELSSGVPKQLDLMDADLQIETMGVGDYCVSSRCCIERKTIDDFFNSLFRDRKLFSQLIDLANAYERPILIIEGGSPLCSGRSVDPKAVQGVLNALALMRIPVLYSATKLDTAQIICMIATKEQSDERRLFQVHGKRSSMSPRQRKEYVISSFPDCDIGTKKAADLLTHFGSIEKVINASADELQEVDGIGKVIAEKLRGLITEVY